MRVTQDAWQALEEHKASLLSTSLQDLFASDPERFSKFSLQIEDILFDYSKQRITQQTIAILCRLAEEARLRGEIDALFSGKVVNVSEKRSALHMALRDPTDTPILVDGKNVKQEIHQVLERLAAFTEALHRGQYVGGTGKKITDVISLGIGGSDLGPAMVCEALRNYKTTPLQFHFVSNVDGNTVANLFKQLSPETTVCIINSKTFTTPETLENAKSVKAWFQQSLNPQVAVAHLIGVTANPQQAEAFGIRKENIFEFWDFIGGRYSVWSSVGLSIILFLGMKQFKDFLLGAHEIDKHFYSRPFESNIPVLMALLGIWNVNFLGYHTHAVIAYDDGLRKFPDYLQQLEMESNGKHIKKQGGVVSYATAPVLWGGVGCNGQHAYMQLLHQGTQIVPVDFLLAATGHKDFEAQHQLLVASCLSQSKALMEGNTHTPPLHDAQLCEGNRPSTTLLYAKLSPKVLGALIALYEHKVFVQGVLWNINSFDQWGVELGKQLVKKILPCLQEKDGTALDSSTKGLLDFYWKHQKKQ